VIGCLVAQRAFHNEALSSARSTPNSLTAPFCAIRSYLVAAVEHGIHFSQLTALAEGRLGLFRIA
jgi:hypothetical protein